MATKAALQWNPPNMDNTPVPFQKVNNTVHIYLVKGSDKGGVRGAL